MTIPTKYRTDEWWAWIKLSEGDLTTIESFPQEIFEKLHNIVEIEMGRQVIEWKITVEEARWAISYAKYFRTFFKK